LPGRSSEGEQPKDGEDLFVAYLPLIEAVTTAIARRRHLSPDDANDLASLVGLKLLENNCAILRRFQGRSSPRAFLATVIERILLDERVRQWGKWRPSAAARRAGPTAILFERLVSRDRLSFEEACSTLQITHRLAVNREQLETLYAGLRVRTRTQTVATEDLADALLAAEQTEEAATRSDATLRRQQLTLALAAAVERLTDADRLVLRLRFDQGATVARIATIVDMDQRLLYRRLARLMAELKRDMERNGFTAGEIVTLLDRRDGEVSGVFYTMDEMGDACSSNHQDAAAARKDGHSGPAA
jgi:RNA polymerase sigma factor (sigma-70 family)